MRSAKVLVFLVVCSTNSFTGMGQKTKKIVPKETKVLDDRAFWLQEMDRLVRPVLRSLASDSLRINMPQTVSKYSDNPSGRREVAYVEVLGRVLSGIAPWLQLEGGDTAEVALRNQYRQWAILGLQNALDSSKKDFMRFNINGQQLVDASFLALAFVRAPWLWENLGQTGQQRLVASIITTRQFKPVFSNWLLFSAMNEIFLARFGYDWDRMRVDYALQQFEQWYVGDGMYTDGPHFAYDYYNSFVIHPYLAVIANVTSTKTKGYEKMFAKIYARNERYAIIQERLIGSDGTYPASGRSIIYRGAAFHHLADMALRDKLPAQLSVAAVRPALTAVIKRTLCVSTTYTSDGWLTLGLAGSQPSLADSYNNAGSPYLCASIFLPLGLSPGHDFWAKPAEKWTSQKIWNGEDVPGDHGMY